MKQGQSESSTSDGVAPRDAMAASTGELLCVVIEISPRAAVSSSGAEFRRVVEATLALRNAHLMCHHSGEFVCCAALPGSTRYAAAPRSGGGAGSALATALLDAAEAARDRDEAPATAAAVARSLCYARKRVAAAPPGADVGGARLLLLKLADDDAAQYNATMNGIFAASRYGVVVDAASLAAKPSSLMKQAAHLTGGVFLHVAPAKLDQLLASALATFAADAACRKSLNLPFLEEADFRVSCFCCSPPNTLDRAWVCTVCLSVYCSQDKGPCPCTAALRAAAAKAGSKAS